MFAKLKKKVEESEGSDLHKLANSISNATASLAGTFSMSSVKSQENVSTTQSHRGSTTSLASLPGAAIPNDSETAQKIEAKWRQRVSDIEMEWRAKMVIKEHEKEEQNKKLEIIHQQNMQLEEQLKEFSDCQEKLLEAEQILQKSREEQAKETATFQSTLLKSHDEIKELAGQIKKQSLLEEELKNKDILILMLQNSLLSQREAASQQLEEQTQQHSTQYLQEIAELHRNLQLAASHNEEIENLLKAQHEEQEAVWRHQAEASQMQLSSVEAELLKLKSQLKSVIEKLNTERSSNQDFSAKVAHAVEEKNCFVVRNAELSQQLSLCQQQLQRSQKEVDELTCKVNQLHKENEHLKCLLLDLEARDEQSERVCKLRSDLSELEGAVSEKNKTIKLQQQRLADMKKTLQKEMKSQATDEMVNNLTSPCSARKNSEVYSVVSSIKSDPEEVNFKYLKHVIFKFLTSREYEAQHLTRAVSTLLKLTPEEDRLLKETIEWKMSWFRAKPDLGTGQNAMYIPPSY